MHFVHNVYLKSSVYWRFLHIENKNTLMANKIQKSTYIFLIIAVILQKLISLDYFLVRWIIFLEIKKGFRQFHPQ